MPSDGSRDWGYVEVPGVKEFEQMRHNAGENPLPALTQEYYSVSMELSRQLLKTVARVILDAPETSLSDMLDPPDTTNASSSIFRYFRYYELVNRSDACAVHTDIGLSEQRKRGFFFLTVKIKGMLTLIPVSNNPSLEIQARRKENVCCFRRGGDDVFARQHPETEEWVNIEATLQQGDLMVLVGETLETATGDFLPACVHRVVRLSLCAGLVVVVLILSRFPCTRTSACRWCFCCAHGQMPFSIPTRWSSRLGASPSQWQSYFVVCIFSDRQPTLCPRAKVDFFE